jgi:DNA topoisomerase-1
MAKQLVIVESPAKAKTINRYLGPDFQVEASVGHVRDLPKSVKGQPVPGVDIENGFTPTYIPVPGKKKVITSLRKLAKDSDEVWFATDLDREGEA